MKTDNFERNFYLKKFHFKKKNKQNKKSFRKKNKNQKGNETRNGLVILFFL